MEEEIEVTVGEVEVSVEIQDDVLKGDKGDKGDTGEKGERGEPGENGQDGYTPVKGIDYFTSEEQEEFKQEISQQIESDIGQDIQAIENSIQDLNENKADKSEIPDVSGFIDNTVNNLQNYYNKDTADELLNTKVDKTTYNSKVEEIETELGEKIEESDLADYVKNTDYASNSKAGIVKGGLGFNISTNDGYIRLNSYNNNDYNNLPNTHPVSKGTLENVITGKELINNDTLIESQTAQDELISELQEENKELYDAMAKVTGSGTDVTLKNTAKGKMPIEVSGNTEQENKVSPNLVNAKKNSAYTNCSQNGDVITTNALTSTGYGGAASTTFEDSYNISTSGSVYVSADIRLVSGTTDSINAISDKTLARTNGSWITRPTLSNQFQRYCYKFDVEAENSFIGFFVQLYNCSNAVLEIKNIMFSYDADTTYYPYGTAPSPDWESPVKVVTGENTVVVENEDKTEETRLPLSLSSKNKFPTDKIRTDKNWLTVNEDGSVTIRYDSGDNINFTNLFTSNINIPTGNYKLKIFVEGTFIGGNIIVKNIANEVITQSSVTNNNVFTITNNSIGNIEFYIVSAGTNCTIKFMLVEGTEAPTAYEEYYNYELCKIGEYKDYPWKDESTGKWYVHKMIDKYIFNGNESFNLLERTGVNVFQNTSTLANLIRKSASENNIISNYFLGTKDSQGNVENSIRSNITGQVYITIPNTNPIASSVNNFTSWLASNNLITYYVLQTPTDIEITNTTLINQLEAIYNTAKSYKGTTHIYTEVEEGNVAPILDATAIMDLNSLVQN